MVDEGNAVARDSAGTRQRIFGSAKKLMGLLIDDNEDDVIGRLFGRPFSHDPMFGWLRGWRCLCDTR